MKKTIGHASAVCVILVAASLMPAFVNAGVENQSSKHETKQLAGHGGKYCKDDKGLEYSPGSIINAGDKTYRCVSTFEMPQAAKKLAWVQIFKGQGKFKLFQGDSSK